MGYRYDDDRDEEETEKEVTRTRVVVARKGRYGIAPGDLVSITDGFTYAPGGARTGYTASRSLVLVGADGTRVHTMHAGWVLRLYGHRLSAVQRAAVEAVIAAKAEKSRIEREEREARLLAEGALLKTVRAAKAGDTVRYDGIDYELVEHSYRLHVAGYGDVDLSYTVNTARLRASDGAVRTVTI
jgi:hypothetical protein